MLGSRAAHVLRSFVERGMTPRRPSPARCFALSVVLALVGCAKLDESSAVTSTTAAPTSSSASVTVPPPPTLSTVPAVQFPCEPVIVPSTSFASGSAEYQGDVAALQDLADELAAVFRTSGLRPMVIVIGHTDSVPTDFPQGNQGLSEARANAVAAQLVGLGIPATQIAASGVADSQPDPDAPPGPEGDAINRRVEVRVDCG